MEDAAHSQMVSLIWNIADDVLRDVFLRGQYRDVILPMIVLRRLDALLEPTKAEVDSEVKENGIDPDVLVDITRLPYYNTSKWTLNNLKAQAANDERILLANFNEYLLGFSDNVRDVLQKFGFLSKDGRSPAEKTQKLSDNHRLLAVIEHVTDPRINLTDKPVKGPDGLVIPPLDNIGMGKVFEELLRRFNEENNEEAGEHFTPRDAIMLLTRLIFEPIKDDLPKTFSLYDPACGSGGMLTESQRYLIESLGVNPAAIFLSGTEVNPETYAICKADLIIKGTDSAGIRNGNTITQLQGVFANDRFAEKRFGYMITNPPYGKSWKEDKKLIYHDSELLDDRFRVKLVNFAGEEEDVDATPRTSDGQLLFILEMLSKMTPLESQPQGTRIASIHNGSALFTGDAGSGESNTRRYLLENDLVEAIIQLPNNIFYNTGITTYVWIITNKKEERRKGKIQLIDASQAFEKLRKNQGQRNCMIDESSRDRILAAYLAFDAGDDLATKNTEAGGSRSVATVESKIFSNDDFRYYAVTVERPLLRGDRGTPLAPPRAIHRAQDRRAPPRREGSRVLEIPLRDVRRKTLHGAGRVGHHGGEGVPPGKRNQEDRQAAQAVLRRGQVARTPRPDGGGEGDQGDCRRRRVARLQRLREGRHRRRPGRVALRRDRVPRHRPRDGRTRSRRRARCEKRTEAQRQGHCRTAQCLWRLR